MDILYFEKPWNWGAVYKMLTAKGKQHGVSITGDERSGNAAHQKVRGKFAVIGSQIKVTVLQKPWYWPISEVESRVKDYIRKIEREAA